MFPVVQPPHSLDYHLSQPNYSHLDYENTFEEEIEVVLVFWIRYESAEFHETLLTIQEGSNKAKYYYYKNDYYYYFRVKTCCYVCPFSPHTHICTLLECSNMPIILHTFQLFICSIVEMFSRYPRPTTMRIIHDNSLETDEIVAMLLCEFVLKNFLVFSHGFS